MITKTPQEIYGIIKKTMLAAGADKRNANRVAEALLSSQLSGVETHGMWQVSRYVDDIKSGQFIPTAWPEVLTRTKNTALVKGNYTFGLVTAKYATEIAIKKAEKNDMAIVSGVQVYHTGRLGEYAEMAADKRLISFVFSGGFSEETPSAMPYGGAKRVLNTNPFAMGFPAGSEPPVISDFATTTVAGVKVNIAMDKNENLPPGCIVDKEGRPTVDPNDFFSGGGHIPFGAHKGYAIMLATEFLGRIFANADIYADKNSSGPIFRHSGFTIVMFKPDIFCSYSEYVKGMDDMIKRIRNIPPAPGFKEVLLPGDIERRTREERLKNGIPISDSIWEATVKLAKSLKQL